MIFLSGGHHPLARGARYLEEYEYPRTLDWARRITSYIRENTNILVDVAPSSNLAVKINYINKNARQVQDTDPVKLAVEIHFNAAPSGDAHGSETLYAPKSRKGLRAAKAVQNRLGAVCPPDRGVKEGWYQGSADGNIPVAFLAQTTCPAIIVEPGFIYDYEYLDANAGMIIAAISEGIIDYHESTS